MEWPAKQVEQLVSNRIAHNVKELTIAIMGHTCNVNIKRSLLCHSVDELQIPIN